MLISFPGYWSVIKCRLNVTVIAKIQKKTSKTLLFLAPPPLHQKWNLEAAKVSWLNKKYVVIFIKYISHFLSYLEQCSMYYIIIKKMSTHFHQFISPQEFLIAYKESSSIIAFRVKRWVLQLLPKMKIGKGTKLHCSISS